MNQQYAPTVQCSVLWLGLTLVSGGTYDNAVSLRSDMLTGYNTNLIPLLDQSQTMNVNVSLSLYTILEADTVTGVMKTASSLHYTWYDEKLTWTPSSYGNIDDMLIEEKLVWTPPLALMYSSDIELLGQSWMFVSITSGALANYEPMVILNSFCTYNMKFWPFDKQVCEIAIYGFGHSSSKMQIQIAESGLSTSMLIPNSEWMIEGTSSFMRNKNGMPEAIFRVKMKRNSMFYVMTMLLPLIGIGLLNPLVFFLPSDSGERVGFSVTILLAITVFLTVISDMLPKATDPAVLLCILVTMALISSIMCVFLVILNLAIFHRSDAEKINAFYLVIVRVSKCKRYNKVKAVSPPNEQTKVDEAVESSNEALVYKMQPEEFSTDGKVIMVEHDNVSEQAGKMERIDEAWASDITWKDVSYAIDKILFLSVILSMIIPVVTFMAYLPTASDYMEP